MPTFCVCGSKKKIQQCCAKFLTGEQPAKTPVQLMRSRYTAYALGGYGEYLLTTWHPDFRHTLTATDLSIRSTQWLRLTVVANSQKGDKGDVEFMAYFQGENGTELVHHERSVFERIDGQWLYVSGDVF